MLKLDLLKSASLALLILSSVALLDAADAAEGRVPNASLEVTVRQEQDGEIDKALHLFHLLCSDGACALTALTLNQCVPAGSGKPAFFPKVQRTSTAEGSLMVKNVGNVLEAQQKLTDIGGESTTTLRFTYSLGGSPPVAYRVIAFNGGYINQELHNPEARGHRGVRPSDRGVQRNPPRLRSVAPGVDGQK